MRIVVDTNVIVSALVFGGVPRTVFEMIEAGLCDFFYSPDIQIETRRVLHDKFGWDDTTLNGRLPTLWNLGNGVTVRRQVSVVKDDPDDNRVLECGLAAGADVIVSGDRHLLRLGEFEGMVILTPRQFLSSFC